MTKDNLRCVWDKAKGTAEIVDTTNGETRARIFDLVEDNKTFFGILTGAKPGDYIGRATSTSGAGTYEAGISPASEKQIACKVPSLGISALGPKPPL